MKTHVVDIMEELLGFCRNRLHLPADITGASDLLDEGLLDSLLVMRLAAFVEHRWGVRILSEEIRPGNFRSMEALAALIERKMAGTIPPPANRT